MDAIVIGNQLDPASTAMQPSFQPAYQDTDGKGPDEVQSFPLVVQSKSHTRFSSKVCLRCKAQELRRQSGTLFHKFLSLHPYVCRRCSTRQNRFLFHPFSLITLVPLTALATLIVYFALNPPSFNRDSEATRNAADSLTRARSAAGGLSTFEEMMIKKPRTTLDNAAIVKLWNAKVGASVIVKMIHTSIPDYDISANSIIELKQQGVDQSVILAMIDATYGSR